MISVTNSKLVKKRKEIASGSSESSESENEAVNVHKYRNNITDDSDNDESPRKNDSRLKKRKHHHHHHHHHHHKRKHRLTEGERVRHKVQEEGLDEYDSRQYYSTHRRHADDRGRQDDNGQCSNSSGRHRQHRDDSGDRIRHHRKRDGDSRQRRDETSRMKKPSSIQQERDQIGIRRDRRSGTGDSGRTGPRNGEQSVLPADRPIKQERVSPDGNYQWGKQSSTAENKNGPPVEKAKPNFGLSGKLAEETNTFNGVVLKYSEPPEARKPKRRWRFYPFKGDTGLPTLYLHRQSCYLIGRDRKVADIPVDHPSCSKQHAALQYRLAPYQREDGSTGRRVRPYIIDLESANGTYVNNNKIEPKKYIELLEKDVIKFGYSSREYVLLHEQSKDETMDDDVTGNLE